MIFDRPKLGNLTLPQVLPPSCFKTGTSPTDLKFQGFVFEDNITKKKTLETTFVKGINKRKILPVIEKEEVKEEGQQVLGEFYQKWQEFMKIKKFQTAAVMQRNTRIKPDTQIQRQNQQQKDYYRMKRLLDKVIFKMNKKSIHQYLNSQQVFDQRLQILSKLFSSGRNVFEMKKLIRQVLSKSQNQSDLQNNQFITKSSVAQDIKNKEKKYLKELKDRMKDNINKIQEQQDALLDSLSDDFIRRLKLNVTVKRLFNGQHLVQPKIDQVILSEIPNGSVLASKFRLYQQQQQQNEQRFNLFEQITAQPNERQVIEGLKKKIRTVTKQHQIVNNLSKTDKKLLEAIKKRNNNQLAKMLQSEINFSQVRDQWDNSVLHYVARYGNQETVKMFNALDLDEKQKNKMGRTPMEEARRFCNECFVKGYVKKKKNYGLLF